MGCLYRFAKLSAHAVVERVSQLFSYNSLLSSLIGRQPGTTEPTNTLADRFTIALRSSNPESQILDTDPSYQILTARSWIPDPGNKIQATRSWIPDHGYQILATRSCLPDPGYQILAARSCLLVVAISRRDIRRESIAAWPGSRKR